SLRDPALPGLLGAAADVRDATVAAALGCRRNRSSGPALRGVSAGVEAVGFHIVLDEAHPRGSSARSSATTTTPAGTGRWRWRPPKPAGPVTDGRIASRPVLGGLHHVYGRAA